MSVRAPMLCLMMAACAPAPAQTAAMSDPTPAAEPEPQPEPERAEIQEAPPPKVSVDDKGCVVDALAHAAELIVARHGAEIAQRLGRPPTASDFAAPGPCFAAHSLPDLDGDGSEETEVTEECSWGTHGALHLLYFSNRGCRSFAGELVSGELVPLATKSSGVRDLEATWSNGCAGRDFVWTRYRWDGKAYREADKATCAFCDERPPPPGANRHPHCKKVAKSFTAGG